MVQYVVFCVYKLQRCSRLYTYHNHFLLCKDDMYFIVTKRILYTGIHICMQKNVCMEKKNVANIFVCCTMYIDILYKCKRLMPYFSNICDNDSWKYFSQLLGAGELALLVSLNISYCLFYPDWKIVLSDTKMYHMVIFSMLINVYIHAHKHIIK